MHGNIRIIIKRRKNAKYITQKLEKFKKIKFLEEPNGTKHVQQLFTISLPSKTIRNKFSKFLTKKGIMTKIFFEPIHTSEFYKKNFKLKLNNTEMISSKIISLPMFPELTKTEMNYICDSVSEFMEKENCY